MKVYPNPASDVLNICFSKVQRGYLSLFDLSGNCVLKSSIHNQTHIRVSVRDVSAGVYTLEVDGFYQKVFVS